jgi:hypothetical protein
MANKERKWISFESDFTLMEHSFLCEFLSFCRGYQIRLIMAKGPEKNTKNKALHTKLLKRKNTKLQEEKREKALRLKALVTKINQKQQSNETDCI